MTEAGWWRLRQAGTLPTRPGHTICEPTRIIDIEVPLPVSGAQTVRVHAIELEGSDRTAAWQRFLDASPNFAVFAIRTDRIFPIFHFTPRRDD